MVISSATEMRTTQRQNDINMAGIIICARVNIAFDIFFDLAKNDLDEDALYMLSRMTFDGQLNPEQIELFYELQNSASSYGNGYALFNVGLMHERGLGKVKQDYKVAVQYYEKAIKEEMHDALLGDKTLATALQNSQNRADRLMRENGHY